MYLEGVGHSGESFDNHRRLNMKSVLHTFMIVYRFCCFALISFLMALLNVSAQAEGSDETICVAKVEVEMEQSHPQPCGDLSKDNRANSCATLIGGVWVMQHSKCTANGDGTFTYTHCDGQSTMHIKTSPKGTHLCCSKSNECRDAKYVASCMD